MEYFIIDVREPEQYEAGHVNGAVNISADELASGTTKLDDISKETPIIVYCLSGSRSNVAKEILRDMGYTNVTNGINKQFVEQKILKN